MNFELFPLRKMSSLRKIFPLRKMSSPSEIFSLSQKDVLWRAPSAIIQNS